jgi:gliding motility-associated-like protein
MNIRSKLFILQSLILLSLLSAMPTKAQSWLWARQPKATNGPNGESGGESSTDHPAAADRSGNLFITGGVFTGDIIFGADTLKSNFYHAYLAKYDPNGNVLWARQAAYSTSSSSEAYSVSLDQLDNAYITGIFRDTLIFGTDTVKPGPTIIGDVFVTKYDGNGNVKWVQKGYSPWGVGLSIASDPNGNTYVTGVFADTLIFGTDTVKSTLPSPNFNVFLAKLDSTGHIKWIEQSISQTNASVGFGFSVTLDASGRPYITGYISDTVSFGATILYGATTRTILLKYDTNGNLLWAKQPYSSYSEGISLSTDGTNHVYQTGFFDDTLILGSDTLKNPAGKSNAFLVKYDTSGNVVWAEQSHGLAANQWEGFSVACDTLQHGGGNLEISVLTSSSGVPPYQVVFAQDTFNLNTSGASGALILQFDSTGRVVCGNMFSEGEEDDGDGVAVDPAGQHIYLTGDVDGETIIGPDTLSKTPDEQGTDIPFVGRWRPICCKIPITVSPVDTAICSGRQVTLTASGADSIYEWTPSSGLSSGIGSPVTAHPFATTKYTVLGIDSGGCSGTASVTITVNLKPTVFLSPPYDSTCAGDSIKFTAVGASIYSWSPSTGLSCTTCYDPYVKPTATTSYTVIGTSSAGCNDTVQTHVKLIALAITITPSDTICQGATTILTATGGGTYKWSNNATSSSISVNPANTTTYTVVVNNGCVDSATTKVSIDAPSMSACCNDTIVLGDSVQLNATGTNTYAWSPDVSLNCFTCPNPFANPSTTTTYTVTGTDNKGCSVDRTLIIDVESACKDFTVPNIFTPNNDGINDQLVIDAHGMSNYSITIYDRWGKQMFSSKNVNDYWNGKIDGNGALVPDGVYYYIINAACSSKSYNKKGFIEVVGEK